MSKGEGEVHRMIVFQRDYGCMSKGEGEVHGMMVFLRETRFPVPFM